jgi:cytochrome P450
MAEARLSLREGITTLGKDSFIAKLHDEAPIYRDENGFWVVSKFEDVRALLLDHARFSSNAMAVGFPLISDDPPRHSVLRSLLARAFTPAAMEAMRPQVDQLARDLVAAIPAGKEIDIVDALTTPLPVAVIAGMMGVPNERAMDFKRWSNAIVGIQDSAMTGDRMKVLGELNAYFAGLSAQRRAAPGDDLVTALTKVKETNEELSDQQVVQFCILLMIAGNETTTNLLGNLLNRILDQPEDWARLRADPSLIDGAIEESLRLDSPAQMVIRRAKEDVEVGGAQIKAGETIMVYLASANRDPEKWNDPANFEVARERERHVAFGHGVHTCIGAPLARMEAKSAMTALLARFGKVERGVERGKRTLGGGILFGFRSLPVILS